MKKWDEITEEEMEEYRKKEQEEDNKIVDDYEKNTPKNNKKHRSLLDLTEKEFEILLNTFFKNKDKEQFIVFEQEVLTKFAKYWISALINSKRFEYIKTQGTGKNINKLMKLFEKNEMI